MKEFWKKYKFWGGVLGYAIFMAAIIYGAVFPIMRKIRYASDEVQKRNIDNEISQKRIGKIPEIENQIKLFSEKENECGIMLEPDKEIDFIKNLESLAESTGNKISLKIDETKPKSSNDSDSEKNKSEIKNNLPHKEHIIVKIDLEGDYPELVNFINKIENMKYHTNVIAMNISKKDGNNFSIRENGDSFSVFQAKNAQAAEDAPIDEGFLESKIDLAVYIKK